MSENQSAMGDAFNDSWNDDTFYLPPEIFDNEEFKRGHGQLHLAERSCGPDDHLSTREIRSAPTESTASTRSSTRPRRPSRARRWRAPRSTSAAPRAAFKDMQDGNNYDLLIAAILALALIFTIMLIITRSVVAAAVIVGTVVLSLGASFGLSVLVWQHVLGIELQFMVMAMAVIILLAVGADYNLLLVARSEGRAPAGVNTAIIRAMGGSGSVVTAAGLVFAFTMISMVVSELTVVAQMGSTIGMGLLFDTLVIRAFMTPSIAALMGKWFWWPQVVRSRPVPAPWPKPRPPEQLVDRLGRDRLGRLLFRRRRRPARRRLQR